MRIRKIGDKRKVFISFLSALLKYIFMPHIFLFSFATSELLKKHVLPFFSLLKHKSVPHEMKYFCTYFIMLMKILSSNLTFRRLDLNILKYYQLIGRHYYLHVFGKNLTLSSLMMRCVRYHFNLLIHFIFTLQWSWRDRTCFKTGVQYERQNVFGSRRSWHFRYCVRNS